MKGITILTLWSEKNFPFTNKSINFKTAPVIASLKMKNGKTLIKDKLPPRTALLNLMHNSFYGTLGIDFCHLNNKWNLSLDSLLTY